ncbi:hypothetical protein SDC9_17392 [bioreactor metagenome]|uniref:Uncharacterized protein n=1 Tax=bioreactor metagenome TaxID=1076179 RepID=A0A644TXE6_9ZZZZ
MPVGSDRGKSAGNYAGKAGLSLYIECFAPLFNNIPLFLRDTDFESLCLVFWLIRMELRCSKSFWKNCFCSLDMRYLFLIENVRIGLSLFQTYKVEIPCMRKMSSSPG